MDEVSLRTGMRLELVGVRRAVWLAVEKSGLGDGMVDLWVLLITAALEVNEGDPELWEGLLSGGLQTLEGAASVI